MSVQNAAKTSDTHEGSVQEQKRERADKIDFKMVTFSLAGKEYGIDIMNIKEIAHAGKFTYVPNAAPFVRGVYNLRGDIISIIDLRTMFHLPSERKSDEALESLLILRVEEHVFGVIVDNIDKVVGISSLSIQAPHPIFGDINVKYIKGIVENAGKLFIILNVEKLFAPKKAKDDTPNANPMARVAAKAGDLDSDALSMRAVSAAGQELATGYDTQSASTDQTADFIKETLYAFKRFAVSPVNESWFNLRCAEWKSLRKAMDLQLKDQSEADQFLESFFSPCTGELWTDDYAGRILSGLPTFSQKAINIWNPGCGKGLETYSLVCLLKKHFPELRVKIWANDSDLLSRARRAMPRMSRARARSRSPAIRASRSSTSTLVRSRGRPSPASIASPSARPRMVGCSRMGSSAACNRRSIRSRLAAGHR